MRRVIEAGIYTSLQSLEDKLDTRFSLQSQNIVIHYLDEGCQAEVWIGMPDGVTSRECYLISSRIQDELMFVGSIVSASVLFTSI